MARIFDVKRRCLATELGPPPLPIDSRDTAQTGAAQTRIETPVPRRTAPHRTAPHRAAYLGPDPPTSPPLAPARLPVFRLAPRPVQKPASAHPLKRESLPRLSFLGAHTALQASLSARAHTLANQLLPSVTHSMNPT
ncbi:unnamed protein product [Parajaminaea phylloscopi]